MTDYIKKADAYRIAVHGTDQDVAYKIQQLQPENVIAAPELHIEVKMRSKIDWETLKRRLLTDAEKCDKVEVEE